jgi:hypothetical protein
MTLEPLFPNEHKYRDLMERSEGVDGMQWPPARLLGILEWYRQVQEY